MKTSATLKNFTSTEGKNIVTRNLNRIMDIVILDMDIENSTITFLHASKAALDRVKKELKCIGFPVSHLQLQNNKTTVID
ncbi:hypothetical protein JQC67_10565 [Aurantibacter crassamenti]|uniref:hypothetical protein n=1 Tax=Aurantibacter crassamenti TaxID=1837375 RepID=UPI0019397636|nr:hypothetical protein [Aurantibacter crassamenti]MBM1106581.1 hypothetical protein [Aurantibacter crassamenti]